MQLKLEVALLGSFDERMNLLAPHWERADVGEKKICLFVVSSWFKHCFQFTNWVLMVT